MQKILVDNTSLILLVLILFSPFIAAVKKIKIGDFEAEIEPEEVKRVARQVDESLPSSTNTQPITAESNGVSSAIKALAESDPVVALAKLRIEIETKLRRLLDADNPSVSGSRPDSLPQVIRKLMASELLAPDLGAALREIIAICNRAIHGEDIRDIDARKIIDKGVELLEAIDQIVREYGVVNSVETVIIGDAEVEEFASSRYRMKTIVPLVHSPERHTYELSQDELKSFLEGYSEYAEFIISLEKI